MAETIDQPSRRPTNKTIAFLAGTVITNAAMHGLEAMDALAWLASDTGTLRELVFGLVSLGIGSLAAWKTRDRPNVPVDGSQSGV